MRMERIAPDQLIPSSQHRGLDQDAVLRLMDSIQRIGLQTPPTARYAPDEHGELRAILVAGAHRTEACRRLGMPFIDVSIMDGTDADARMWEISENLHRAELTAVERAEHIEEWRRLAAEKVAQVVPPSGGVQPKESGVRKTARDLGVSHTEVQRASKIASLPPETREQARDEKWTATRLLREAKPVPLAPPPRNDLEVEEAQIAALMAAWNKAGQRARERFLEIVDQPVFKANTSR